MSYNPDNVFARIIRGEIPANKVYEDDTILAFHDISRAAPTHVLVVPKGEFRNFVEFTSKSNENEIANFFKRIGEIAKKLGANDFRLVSNNGTQAGQTVDHFHVHILAGKDFKTHL